MGTSEREPGGALWEATVELQEPVIGASEMEQKGQGVLEEEDWDWVSALPFVRREIRDETPASTFPPLYNGAHSSPVSPPSWGTCV